MQIFQPVRQEIVNFYRAWSPKRNEWLTYAKENKEFFFNDVEKTRTLYTAKQKKHINDSIGITSTINYIFSTVSQALALTLRNKPSHKIISVDGRSEELGQVLEKAKFAVLYQSKEKAQTTQCIKDVFLTGHGFKMAVEDTRLNKKNLFGVKSKFVPIENVVLDADVKNSTFENEQGFFIEQSMVLHNVKKEYPDIVKRLVDEEGKPIDLKTLSQSSLREVSEINSDLINKLDVMEFWEPIYTTMYLVDMNGDIERMFVENIGEEQAVALGLDEDYPEDRKREDIFWQRTLIFGNYEVDIEIKPQSHSPLTKYFFEWAGSPYDSYGMVHYERGIQEGIDALIRLFILNGILSNNKGYRATHTNIPLEDLPNWEKYGADPTKIKFFEPDERGSKVIVPEQEKVEPMSPFFPTVLQLFKSGMEGTTGMFPYMAGDTSSGKIDAFSTLSQYQNTAMQRPQMIIDRILDAEEDHGNALIELIIDNLKPDKNYFFFDEDSEIKEFTIAKEISTAIKTFDYLLLSIPSEANATQKDATAEAFSMVAQSTADPIKRDLYLSEAMRLKGIRGGKQLLEKADLVKNVQSQLAQKEDELKRQTQLANQMQNRTINAETEVLVLKNAINQLTKMAKQEGAIEQLTNSTKQEINKKEEK